VETVRAIEGKTTDLVLWRCKRPDDQARRSPHFIFITAVDDFAVRAFDVDALD
jgi:hypothetical protein